MRIFVVQIDSEGNSLTVPAVDLHVYDKCLIFTDIEGKTVAVVKNWEACADETTYPAIVYRNSNGEVISD